MITCQEPGCGRAMKNLSGLHMHYRHKHDLSEGEWPDIRAKYGNITNETVSKSSITPKSKPSNISFTKSETPETPETTQKEELESISELTGDEPERAENVEIEWDKDKPLEMLTHRTLPSKAMKLDPRIDFVFSYLKSNGEIPHDWKMGDFMNHYVLEHLRMKDGLSPSIIKTFGGNPNNREVITMDDKFRNVNKEKTPDESLAELENARIRALKIKEIERGLGSNNGSDSKGEQMFGGEFMKNMQRMRNEMIASKMAAKMVKEMLGEDEGESSKIKDLEAKIAKQDEERKIDGLKSAIESLKQQISTQSGSKELTAKDWMAIYMADKKGTDELKGALHSKDTEMLKQSMDSTNREILNELKRERNRPNIMGQIKDITDTAEVFKKSGFLGKKEEKSSGELAKELIEGVVTSVSSSPAVQNYINKMAEGSQQTPYTPEQLAMLQQQAQNPKPNPGPMNQDPEQMDPRQMTEQQKIDMNFKSTPNYEVPETPDDEAERYANLVNVSDAADRKKRMG